MVKSKKIKAWYSKILRELLFYRKTSNNHQMESLDGLRGIAVLLVFLDHLSKHGLLLAPFLDFSGLGGLGVYLFFVLSSFLLTSQFFRVNINLNSSTLWLNYALRRLLRIYPLYIFIMTIYLIFPSFQYSEITVLRHLMLAEGFNQFWTIPVEMKYYVILPIIVWLFVRILKMNLMLSTIACLVLIVLNFVVNETIRPNFITTPSISIFPYLPIFLLGSLTALVHIKFSNSTKIKSMRLKYFLEFVAFNSFLIILMTSPQIWNWIFSKEMPWRNHYYIYGFLWSIFLVCHVHGYGFIKKSLSHSFFRFMGMISFSLYLWHIPVLGYVKAHLYAPASIKVVVIFAVTVAVSTVTYLAIERPFSQIKIKSSKTKA